MDSKSQLTVDIIAKVAEGKISIINASKILSKSRRTIERYLQKYQTMGIQFIIHGNTGRAPINKTSDALKNQVQDLIKNKYYDFNLQHLSEKLSQNENIQVKRETLRTWAHDIHHVKRAKRRRSQPRKRRERMESPGLLIQMDGSPHNWFGNEKTCLIAMIDDANSEIHAEFFKSETTLGCLKVLHDFVAKKGIFKTLYVDRAGIFGGPKRCNFSQMQRACEELGIEVIFANSPQGKGRVERAFDTLQDRLVPELRLENITTIQGASEYLQNTFIPQFWESSIQVIPNNPVAEYTPLPQYLSLDDICVLKEYRKIRNDHTFSFGNKFYLIDTPLRESIAKQKIEIRTTLDGTFHAFFANKKLKVSEVTEPTKPSQYDLEIQRKIDVLDLAEKLNNVSEAARISGCSRDTIYRNRKLLKEKGPQALKRTFRSDIHHKNRPSKSIEELIIKFSLENPHLGQAQVSAHFKSRKNIEISSSGVRNIWLREKMNTSALRVQKAKKAELVA